MRTEGGGGSGHCLRIAYREGGGGGQKLAKFCVRTAYGSPRQTQNRLKKAGGGGGGREVVQKEIVAKKVPHYFNIYVKSYGIQLVFFFFTILTRLWVVHAKTELFVIVEIHVSEGYQLLITPNQLRYRTIIKRTVTITRIKFTM